MTDTNSLGVMKYKKITNKEAMELFLSGSDKLRVKPPGFNVPVILAEDIPARYFINDSNQEFYIAYEQKKFSYDTKIVNTDASASLCLTIPDLSKMLYLGGFSSGTRISVTIEESVND